jgi:acyl-CoA synthetase (AMP-forming)/AMP-acid ligase II
MEAAVGNSWVRFEPSGIVKSTGEIWAESERVAGWLTDRVGSGGAVAAFLTNTPACPAGIFGVWRSGNDLVSLPHPGRGADLATYVQQIADMCQLAQTGIILIDAEYQALLPPLPLEVLTYQDLIASRPTGTGANGSGGLIQFTSGSISAPKGVVLTAEALAANIRSILEVVQPTAGVSACSWLPLSHDMGLVGMFLSAFSGIGPEYGGGGGMLLQTPESFLADPPSWLQNCSEIKATLTTAPNFAFDLASRFKSQLSGIDLSHMRICITGAERVNAATLQAFTDTFAGAGLSPTTLCPAYGMAEAALAITMIPRNALWTALTVDANALADGVVQPTAPGDATATYVSNGPPIPDMQVQVVDTEGRDAGTAVGDVQVRGASMLDHYLGAELKLHDGGWFATRDRGFLHDGELYLVGRADESIIIGGQNYYAADVEHTLEHPAVRKGNIAAVPLTEGGYWLIAEPVTGRTAEQLVAAGREITVQATKKTGIKPSMVGFIERGAMPKTPSGKLQRLKLRDSLERGAITLTTSWPPRP